jgi:hypothetical protein
MRVHARELTWPQTGVGQFLEDMRSAWSTLPDGRYFMNTEDVDVRAAIHPRHRRVLCTVDPEVAHLRGRSAASVPRAAEAASGRFRRPASENSSRREQPVCAHPSRSGAGGPI